MGTPCFSAVSILRCEALSRTQYQVLIIPPALEAIFVTSLFFINTGKKRHLLLTAEGWSYLALSVLELLSHILPAVRENLSSFRTIDIILGALSNLPLFFYIVFLFLLIQGGLTDILSLRFRRFLKLMLAAFIPLIIALNSVASFLDVKYGLISSANTGQKVVGIGFDLSSKSHDLTTFFNDFTLALLAAYEAINFAINFTRVVNVVINQRNIEVNQRDEAHFFRGTGWIAGGLKLGVIETVIGFAESSFGIAFSRRIVRMVSRAFLCLGLAKGMDIHEDFLMVQEELMNSGREKRKSKLRLLISNPRYSTVREGTPMNNAFRRGSVRSPAGLSQTSGKEGQRVTVHYEGNSAPTLHMRFSALGLPTPATIVDNVHSPTIPLAATISLPPTTISQPQPILHRSHSASLPNVFANMHSRGFSEFSTQTGRDSLNSLITVQDLASRFPGLPPRVTSRQPSDSRDNVMSWEDPYASSYFGPSRASSADLTRNFSSRSNSFKRKPVPSSEGFTSVVSPVISPVSESLTRSVTTLKSEGTGSSPFSPPSVSVPATSTAPTEDENPFSYDANEPYNVGQSNFPSVHKEYVNYGHADVPWDIDEDSAAMVAIKSNPPALRRLKTIGQAPQRFTPTPTRTEFSRGSVYIQPIVIPPRSAGMPEAVQRESQSSIETGIALSGSEVSGLNSI